MITMRFAPKSSTDFLPTPSTTASSLWHTRKAEARENRPKDGKYVVLLPLSSIKVGNNIENTDS